MVASIRYPLHRLHVINGNTLSSSTLDCCFLVALFSTLAAAVVALAEAFSVSTAFGGLPFLRFGGGTVVWVVGVAVVSIEAGLVVPLLPFSDPVVTDDESEDFFVVPLITWGCCCCLLLLLLRTVELLFPTSVVAGAVVWLPLVSSSDGVLLRLMDKGTNFIWMGDAFSEERGLLVCAFFPDGESMVGGLPEGL